MSLFDEIKTADKLNVDILGDAPVSSEDDNTDREIAERVINQLGYRRWGSDSHKNRETIEFDSRVLHVDNFDEPTTELKRPENLK
jgi:hypothetical protein